ncbi:MAG TPA: hypothetical protein VNO70_04300 [Blastocatellia bacterium]|nr:hypothetical protein [Blastocatellia bacterium]
MLFRKPRVGQEISTFCGKCKDERTHIVAAMEGETVRKVTCTMCGSTHNYKQKAAASAAKKPSSRGASAGGRKSKSSASAFTIDPARPAKPYSMTASFDVGDVINHVKFGLGRVESLNPPNKIEVRFQEGVKTMLHNMKK